MGPDGWALRSLAITDRRRLTRGWSSAGDGAAVVAYAEALASAGVDAIQVRERDLEDRELFALARDVVRAVAGSGCRVLVNERAHVAWTSGADGVHLRADGMSARRVRRVSPADAIIGRSLHQGDAATDTAGVDFVLFGTVYPSESKRAGAPAAGLDALASMVRAMTVPVLAIGGMTVERCAGVRRAGARGIAGIELFASAYEQGSAALAATRRAVHEAFEQGEERP